MTNSAPTPNPATNSATAPAMVCITQLTKVFRDFWRRPRVTAVDALSLTVGPGEVLGLLGPNGSGKSTTIKLLLGLLHPTAGAIEVLGGQPTDTAVRARIGYLPEISHLYHYLTPRETLDFYGGLFDLPRRERRERADQLLERVGLSDVANRAVGEFSKGMARRLGLAQALLNNPDLVILDEPTSGLDPIGRHAVKELVRTLGRQGKTVILSSHLLGEIEDVCDRVVILFRGRLQAEGPLNDLLARPDRILLHLPDLPAQALEELRNLIAGHTGAAPEVTRDNRTLEQFFLDVVHAAGRTGAERQEQWVAPFLQSSASAAGDPST